MFLKANVINMKNRVVVEGVGGGEWEDVSQRYKLGAVRGTHSEDLMCSVVTVVQTTALYT